MSEEVSMFDVPFDEEPEKTRRGRRAGKKPVVNMTDMTDDELAAELQRRSQLKAAASKTKWVSFLDEEPDGKLLAELTKLDKLTNIGRNKRREKDQYMLERRVFMFPVTMADLTDEFLADVIKKCPTCFYNMVNLPDKETFGLLNLNFQLKSQCEEILPSLREFRDDVMVIHNQKDGAWRKNWHEICGKSPEVTTSDYSLFLPSLPQTMIDSHLIDMFPTASSVTLVDVQPRKHAYVEFHSDDVAKAAVDALNEHPPVKSDLPFCGVLSYKRLSKLSAASNEAGGTKKPAQKASGQTAAGKPGQQGKNTPGKQTPAGKKNTGNRGGNRQPNTGGQRPWNDFALPSQRGNMPQKRNLMNDDSNIPRKRRARNRRNNPEIRELMGDIQQGGNRGQGGQLNPSRVKQSPGNTPRGRDNAPRGRGNAPRGRDNTLRSRDNAPFGRGNTTRGQGNAPRGRGNAPRGRANSSRDRGNISRGPGNDLLGGGSTAQGLGNLSRLLDQITPSNQAYGNQSNRQQADWADQDDNDYPDYGMAGNSANRSSRQYSSTEVADYGYNPSYHTALGYSGEQDTTQYSWTGADSSRAPTTNYKTSNNSNYVRQDDVVQPLWGNYVSQRSEPSNKGIGILSPPEMNTGYNW